MAEEGEELLKITENILILYLATLPPVCGSALGSSTVAAAAAPRRAIAALSILSTHMVLGHTCFALDLLIFVFVTTFWALPLNIS